MNQAIYGLLLVGGESRRMGSDKALLSYDGKTTQLEHTAALLQTVCPRVFISQREEQPFPTPEGTEAIFDSVEDARGPLRGILSAMHAHPDAHWLVLACDLPNLTTAALDKLIAEFRAAPSAELTAYRSSHDGLPEPLCAIYPVGSDAGLLALAQELGKSCPRKLLIIKEAALVEQDDPRSLDNINTAEEFKELTQ
ncbi:MULTISPECIES: molybdenum cofactor guanylyltransferase [unclassified Lentimonas]|uniref:molybdenum cofactor guanylyltransferase n=1 Tax=unclassified Lentimonas TaxID=2630993 RepID=UPI001326B11D|nr:MULTISPECIES: NTP transferase domain-containing protein [unclassified Lentimonas]CAA6695449.1 Molybdopterin-guanine dinucleotide biosynthesis protein MobA [Lentimonas sp. CC10]CAA6696622.1 Molybdopterin-guanine dinucleotide biosynthesis protein MobA [Lentimonas sp. CC19]CAA7071298.1 Molybdopterin-guanine dinucleotide biosynthesis protein MobA [Lentimonas sp. CC11]